MRRIRVVTLVPTFLATETTHMERRTLVPPAFLGFLALVVGLALCARSLPAQTNAPRFEVGPVFSAYHARLVATPDEFQLGGRFTWNWLPHLAFEAEYDSTLREPHPIFETQFFGGNFSQALFGIKSDIRWKNWGVFAKFRPGFVSYSKVITSLNFATPSNPLTFGRLTDAAYDAGGGAEFLLSRHWLFRYDASDLIVHQGPHSFVSNGQKFVFSPFTVNNFETEVSVAFRF